MTASAISFLARKMGLLAGLVMVLSGCYRLDFTLYNPDNSITEYKLNDGTAEDWGFELPPAYRVADSLTHLFTLESQAADEATATTIYAAYVGDTQRIAQDTVILYCHGNSTHMDIYWGRILLLANAGHQHRFGVMALDYRGYGLSEGTPTEDGLYADVDACLAWLKAHGLTDDRLVIYGYSMGSAPATELTAQPRSLTPSWLMLEAPFASAEVMVQDASGLAMPGSFVTNLAIDNGEEIKSVMQPFYLIHGLADDFLAYETHGKVVWKNYQGSRGKLVEVPGGDHGDTPIVMGLEPYLESVLAFLENR